MPGLKVTRIATAGQELAGGSTLDATYAGTDVDVTTGLPLDGLLDVNAPAPADQDVLTWDDAAGEWIAQAGGGGLDVALATVAATGATETIDVSVARTYDLTLTADCTLTLTGATTGEAWFVTLLIRQDGTGGWDVTWPGSVEWPTGGAPTIDPDINALTVVTLGTVDGGTVWLGFPTGGSGTLDDLADVNAPAPSDNDVLAWDTGTGMWVPVAPGSGSGDASGQFIAGWDGGGSALTAGGAVDIVAPFTGTITSWTLLPDVSGSAVVGIGTDTYAGFPTFTSIVASDPPTLTSATKATGSALTGWTTAVTAGDILRFTLSSASTVTRLLCVVAYSRP